MELEYTKTGKPFKVNDALGKVLIAKKLARYPAVMQTAAMKTESVTNDADISARTGQPKRTYRRRDLKAEE